MRYNLHADVDYQFAVERLQEIHAGWVKDMYTACEEFQQLDEERIAYVRNILWAYANANSAASVADDAVGQHVNYIYDTRRDTMLFLKKQCMEATRACLEKLDVSAAIDRFIADHGTGSDIPAPLTYRNYYEVQTSPNQQRAMATLKDYGVMVRSARSLVGVGKSPVDRPSRETALRSSSAALAAAPAPAVSTLAQQLSFSLATQSAAPGEVAPEKSPTTKALPSPFAEDIVVAAEEHIPPKQDLHQAVANSYSSSECEPSPPPAYKSMEVDAQSTAEQSVPDTNPFASEMQEVTRVADEKAIPAPIVNDEGKAVPAPTPKETVVQSWNPFD